VLAEFFEGFVLIPIVHDGTVIRAEDDEGVFGEAETVEGFHDLADGPIELDDGVGPEAMWGDTGDVGVGRGVEEEEGLVFVLLDEGV